MLLEAQRLEQRTRYDLEMLMQLGYCTGIENYSRHLSGRKPGERPETLLDYFPKDYLLFIDESHVTIPQLRAMYAGDRSRKETLVRHGFRLPSAFDNRPLIFEEFESSWARQSTFQQPQALMNSEAQARSWSKSSGRRVCWIRRWKCGL